MTRSMTVKELALELDVARNTLTLWIQQGKVKAKKSGIFPGKTTKYIIPPEEVARLLKLRDQQKKLSK